MFFGMCFNPYYLLEVGIYKNKLYRNRTYAYIYTEWLQFHVNILGGNYIMIHYNAVGILCIYLMFVKHNFIFYNVIYSDHPVHITIRLSSFYTST